MTSKRLALPVIAVLVLVLLAFGAQSASADSGAARYQYLLGTGFVAGLPAALEGPDVAMAENGDTIALTGQGTFSLHPKSLTGGGSFTHKDAAGHVRASGTWTATQLLSFHSFGSGSVQGIPPQNEGGKALLRIHLSPGFDAILRVTCLLGDKVPAGAHEGIRLAGQGALNFNQEVSGETLFIRQ